ncbi:MAG: DUF4288 domain-containing protein [Nibricoccus sp.]
MKRKVSKSIPHRNISPYGWWIASYIERFEWKSENRKNPHRRCLAYENTVIIKAADREEAYRKSIKLIGGRSPEWQNYGEGAGKPGRWVPEGLTSLLAIYEELKDGAEILWRVHANRSVKTVRSRVKKKHELETFID